MLWVVMVMITFVDYDATLVGKDSLRKFNLASQKALFGSSKVDYSLEFFMLVCKEKGKKVCVNLPFKVAELAMKNWVGFLMGFFIGNGLSYAVVKNL